MEPYKVYCDHCEKKLRVSIESLIGKRIRCPSCQEPFTIPGPPEENILEEQLVEAGSGVGSGVGSFAGINTGDSAAGRSDANFNFTQGDEEYEESEGFDYEAYDDDDTEELHYDESSFINEDEEEYYSDEEGYYESSEEEDYSGAYNYEKKPTDWKTVALISAPGIIVLIVIGAIILSEKGYFSEGGRDNRQDGTRFAELGREVDGADLWGGGAAPTALLQYHKQCL